MLRCMNCFTYVYIWVYNLYVYSCVYSYIQTLAYLPAYPLYPPPPLSFWLADPPKAPWASEARTT